MSLLEIKNLHKKFGKVKALSGLSLHVNPGELLALVGPSGCGKTTLLRLIAGFEKPDSGDVLLRGSSISGLRAEVRKIGLVFQDYALFPHMNVEKNVSYGLKFDRSLTQEQKHERVNTLLNKFGLSELCSRLPDQLSAGQQQRTALARALAPQPQILLLDEPFSALDQSLRRSLRTDLKRLQHDLKISMIHVTHDQEEALAIADRVAVMSQGQIEQIGAPRDIYHRPATEFVARFVGQGNLISANVVDIEFGNLLAELPGDIRIKLRRSRDVTISPGDHIKFLLRPENISVGAQLENRMTATITQIEFLGDAVSLSLSIGSTELLAKIPSALKEASDMQLGQQIGISFNPEHCKLIQ